MFRIYYADGLVVEGTSKDHWKLAPKHGVQVISSSPRKQSLRWSYSGGAVYDKDLWTGVDKYNPFGYGVKYGSLIPDEEYYRIWERACADPVP